MAEAVPHDQVIRITPRRAWGREDLTELWRYRELLGILALRDIKIRYKQTVVGFSWAVIQPLVTMGLFSVTTSIHPAATRADLP